MGPAVAGVSADSASFTGLVDGGGLGNVDNDRLIEHSTSTADMWLEQTGTVGEGLVFDLGQEQPIESIQVWNYNRPAYTDMGVQQCDIAVWTAGGGWKTVLKDAVLQEAEGSDDYDEPTLLTFEAVPAAKVRFENLTGFNSELKQVGLSEITFHQPLGPAACNPEPADNSVVSYLDTLRLSWMAGRGAVVHDVYVGESEEQLQLLGRVKGVPEVTVSGLAVDKDYYWRIDEVGKDGVVEPGEVWSFKLQGRQVAHWKLDETAEDAFGQFSGTIHGQPAWETRNDGQAVRLNGRDAYIEIPAMHLNTNTLTVCAWLNAPAQDATIPGVVFCRTANDKTCAGINLLGDRLRYHWNGLAETYNWNSGLTIPQDRWVFAALAIQPQKATLYLYDPDTGELQIAENPIVHTAEEFDGPLCIGKDSGFDDRYFKGTIDAVQLFDFTLSRAQIEQVYRGQAISLSGETQIELVGADLVTEEQSLEEIAAEQSPATDGGKKKNLFAVGVIVLVFVGFAGVSVLRKKK